MSQQTQPSPSFLSDSPADRDVLDYKAYRDALISIMEGLTAESSLTIAIFGAWGSGKTTLLKMVKDELTIRKTQTIWVNVWQFGNEQDVWTAFLQSLLLKIKKEIPFFRRLLFDLGLFRRRINWERVSKKIPELFLRMIIVVVPLAISLTYLRTTDQSQPGKIAAGTGTVLGAVLAWLLLLQPYVKAIRERVKVDLTGLVKSSELKERVSLLDQFKTYFEDMVASMVGENGRAIIFVDDLDRCPPERIVQVLDAIKLFLDIPRCVYVIGLDREIVEQAIKVKFEKYKDPETEAREYLEKIIGLPFDLPPLSGQQMEELVSGLHANLPDAERSTRVFALGQEPNPRKVKRTINMFLMTWLLAQARKQLEGVIKPTRLAKIVVLQHSYRDLYLILNFFPGYLGEIEAYFRERAEPSAAKSVPDPISAGDSEPGAPPDHLKAFVANDNLRQLLTLHNREEKEANFTSWESNRYVPMPADEVTAYIRLTRSVAPEQKQAPATIPVTSQPPFINRQRELQLFSEVLSGNRPERILTIEGRSGMGKSALLRRYTDICSERNVPFTFIRLTGDLRYIDLLDAILAGFQRFFEEFETILSHGADNRQLNRAIISELNKIAANGKVVIFVDDYERGSASIQEGFLSEFLPALKNNSSIVVVVAGQIEVSVPPTLATEPLVLRMKLAPFSQEDVAKFFKSLDLDMSDEAVRSLQQITDGSPAQLAAAVDTFMRSRSS